jgi:signal transduction histidine kinase
MAEIKRLTRHELQSRLNVDEGFLLELERELLVIRDEEGWYTEESIERVRLCRTLHDELGVNLAGVEVVLHLLDTIRAERAQFRDVLQWISTPK